MNQLPEIRGTDHAIWRRLQPIPFEVQIPPAERDPLLPGEVAASKELYDAYVRWSDEGGEVVLAANIFGKRLASLGFEAWKATEARRSGKESA